MTDPDLAETFARTYLLAMDKRVDNGQKKEASSVLDLSDFVAEVDRFSRLIEPFALMFYTIDDIRR